MLFRYTNLTNWSIFLMVNIKNVEYIMVYKDLDSVNTCNQVNIVVL